MADRFTSGVPDNWYSGRYDLWVEYKYFPEGKLPPVIDLTNPKAKVCLSPLQQKWLLERHAQGRNVAVIAGSYAGGVVFPGVTWNETTLTRDQFLSLAQVLRRPRDVAALLATLLHPKEALHVTTEHHGGSARAA